LNSRVEKLSRDAWARIVGGAKRSTPRDLGADRLLGLLQAVHRAAHDAQPRDRVLDVDRQRPAHRGDAVAQRAALVLARIETGTSARSSSPSVRTPRECSQPRSAPPTTAARRR
jgi:hypothetical protein